MIIDETKIAMNCKLVIVLVITISLCLLHSVKAMMLTLLASTNSKPRS